MKDWYLRQTPRDRLIVLIVGIFALVSLFYLLVWYPLSSGLDNNKTLLSSRQQTLTEVQQGAAQLKALGGGNAQAAKVSDKAPYLLIDEVIRNAGIGQPERVEPSGANGARVQFSEVSFDKLVGVIAELEMYGLKIDTLNISRKNSGTVSARFNMEKI